MAEQYPDPRAEELVKSKESTARAEPYCGGFFMRKLETVTFNCPCCARPWTRQVSTNLFPELLTASTAAEVWHRAAVRMGLLEENWR